MVREGSRTGQPPIPRPGILAISRSSRIPSQVDLMMVVSGGRPDSTAAIAAAPHLFHPPPGAFSGLFLLAS